MEQLAKNRQEIVKERAYCLEEAVKLVQNYSYAVSIDVARIAASLFEEQMCERQDLLRAQIRELIRG